MQTKTEKGKNPFTVEVESEEKMEKDEVKKEVKPEEIKPILLKKPIETKFDTQIQPKRQWGMFWWGIVTIMLLELIGGGVWWGYRMKVGPPEPTPTPVAVEMPVATPEPIKLELNREAITVDVYNGSGKTGFASEEAQKIGDLGYQIGKVGNAELQKGHTMQLSDDLASMSAEILTDIQDTIGEVSLSDESLGGEFGISIVLGQD